MISWVISPGTGSNGDQRCPRKWSTRCDIPRIAEAKKAAWHPSRSEEQTGMPGGLLRTG